MSIESLLNEALALLVQVTPARDALQRPKAWVFGDENIALVVDDLSGFNEKLEAAYQSNSVIAKRFSRKTIYKHIEKTLVATKKAQAVFSKADAHEFFQSFLNTVPIEVRVLAPISGIRLDVVQSFALGIFEVGYEKNLEWSLSNEDGMFVSAPFYDVYDTTLAIETAKNVFNDFMRLIAFMAGRYEGSIALKIGLPGFTNVGPAQMHTESHAYSVLNADGSFSSSNNTSEILERVPINAAFFANSPDFSKLIELYGRKHKGDSINDMESRIVNAALAIGESLRSADQKNAIIYSCIALETLFSFDDGSLFQKSIGDRLADAFAFLAGTDLDSRLQASKLVKRVYRMRSALVHGGDKNVLGEHVAVNQLNRAIVKQLLNNVKFANVAKIEQLYEMIKTAQYSY